MRWAGSGDELGWGLHSKAHDDACRSFPSSPLPRSLDPARIMASCTSAPWEISRHALHGTVGGNSAVHACVMRALWGGGEGGDWGRMMMLVVPFLLLLVLRPPPSRVMASCTSAPWAISRHAPHGTVGANSAVHACVMWGGGEGGNESACSPILSTVSTSSNTKTKAHYQSIHTQDLCRFLSGVPS